MKRFISLILAALFLCTVAGAETDILFDREIYGDVMIHCVGMDDRLYTFVSLNGGMLESENGYTVTYDFSEPIAMMENEYSWDLYGYSNGSFKPGFPTYFPGTNGLYHLYSTHDPDPDVRNYHICSVELSDDLIVGLDEICEINMNEIDEYFFPESVSLYMCGGHLLMLYPTDIFDDYVLVDYDTAEGEYRIIENDPDREQFNIMGMCPYDDASVLICTLADSADGSAAKIYRYTPEEEAFEELAVLESDIDSGAREFGCPAYDASTDTFYYCERGKAMRGFDTEDVSLLANIVEIGPFEPGIGGGGCVVNGAYVFYNCEAIQIVDGSSGEAKKTTRI